MVRLVFSIVAALAVFGAAARAEDRSCFEAAFSDTPLLMIGKVKSAAARARFLRSGDEKHPSCPSSTAECQNKAFLVPGDLVVIGRQLGDFVCADYLAGKGARSGWLPAAALEPAPLSAASADWSGDWKRIEAEIKIKANGAALTADGDATYGALDPDRVKRGAVNIGEFSGPLALKDGRATYADKDLDPKHPDGCHLRMARAGNFLFVQDNGQCGGNNVSFTGLYRRDGK